MGVDIWAFTLKIKYVPFYQHAVSFQGFCICGSGVDFTADEM